jgi:MFS family permease
MVSMLGNQLTIVAVMFQVFRLTNSSLMVGLVGLTQLPLLVAGSLWGGHVADRVDRRLLLAVTSVVLGLLSAGLALNAQVPGASVVAVFVLASVSSGIAGFSNPARNAAIPRLVKPSQLVGAYSINQTVIQTSTVVGPALAGALIGFVSISSCYWIDAGSFLVLAAATFSMTPMPPLDGVAQTSVRRSVAEGFRYVRQLPMVQCVYLIDLNAMIFGMPIALFPMISRDWYHGGSLTFGLLTAAPAIGGLIGALTTGWAERVHRRGRTVAIAVVAWGLAIVGFGLSSVCWLGVTFLAFAGWADVISAVLRNTILQTTISDHYRGRLSAIQMAVVTGGPRLGNFEAGAVASLTSGGFSVISGGVACVLGVAALMNWRPVFWRDVVSLDPVAD